MELNEENFIFSKGKKRKLWYFLSRSYLKIFLHVYFFLKDVNTKKKLKPHEFFPKKYFFYLLFQREDDQSLGHIIHHRLPLLPVPKIRETYPYFRQAAHFHGVGATPEGVSLTQIHLETREQRTEFFFPLTTSYIFACALARILLYYRFICTSIYHAIFNWIILNSK